MIRIYTLLLSVLLASISQGQSDTLNRDSRGNLGGNDVFILELKNDGLLDLPDGIEMRGYSPGMNIYLYHDLSIDRKKDVFSFGLGYGIASDNYHTNAIPLTINEDGKDLGIFIPVPDSVDFKKNKLALTLLDALFEFRYVNEANGMRVHAGVKGGYLISSHTKFKSDLEKSKRYNIESLNNWRFGIQGRLGFGSMAITGYYSLTELFKEPRSDTALPWHIGIAIIPF